MRKEAGMNTEQQNVSYGDFLTVMPDLKIVCENVTLKVPTLTQVVALAKIAYDGLFPTGDDTIFEWYDPKDPVANARSVVAHQFQQWGSISVSNIKTMQFIILVDNQVVGVQSLCPRDDFLVTREISTGSWLAPNMRGKGFGTSARFAALAFGFEVLEALDMTSSALTTNEVSAAVANKCGYVPDGIQVESHRSVRKVLNRYRINRDQWLSTPRPPVYWEGHEDIAALFKRENASAC